MNLEGLVVLFSFATILPFYFAAKAKGMKTRSATSKTSIAASSLPNGILWISKSALYAFIHPHPCIDIAS